MRVGVIGGGLAGLTVALRRVIAGDRVSLFEASPRLGGQLSTERSEGYVVEHGAEGFVAQSVAVQRLAKDLGILEHLVGQLATRSYAFDGVSLRALERGEAGQLLGFQVARAELGRGIESFLLGMGELIEALAHRAAARMNVQLAAPVNSVERVGPIWRIHVNGGLADEVDALAVATTAHAAAELLEAEFGALATALRQSQAASSLTVSLAYPQGAFVHPAAGTGFIVAEAAQHEGFRACTFSSEKLPGRAPPERALVRLFFRPKLEELSELSDADWTARAERAFGRALDVRGAPLRTWVSRWPEALPIFDAPHRERVQLLELALAARSGYLTGSAFHGSGIDAAVRSAEQLAHTLG